MLPIQNIDERKQIMGPQSTMIFIYKKGKFLLYFGNLNDRKVEKIWIMDIKISEVTKYKKFDWFSIFQDLKDIQSFKLRINLP